ncbi:MAG: hypothetical protein QXT45_03630 [Candidatus Bilamarchaeaceae archaeon]
MSGFVQRRSRREFIKVAAAAAAVAIIRPCALLAEGPIKEIGENRESVDPFCSKKLPALLKGINGSSSEKAQKLFELLRIGNGVLKVDSSKKSKEGEERRPPRTVDEALKNGGDCTELAFVVISAAEILGLEAGGALVHLNNAPAHIDHFVAYVVLDGKKIFIDPQAEKIGAVGSEEKYVVLHDVPSKSTRWMYYREFGNYYLTKKKYELAAKFFKKALDFYDKDAYVYHGLGTSYEYLEDVKNALAVHKKAYELEPQNKKYEKNARIAEFNYEMEIGVECYNSGDRKEAKKHFERAIKIGEGVVGSANIKQAKEYSAACD